MNWNKRYYASKRKPDGSFAYYDTRGNGNVRPYDEYERSADPKKLPRECQRCGIVIPDTGRGILNKDWGRICKDCKYTLEYPDI